MARTIKLVSLGAVLLLIVLAVPFPLANVTRANSCLPNVWVAPPPVGNNTTGDGTQAKPFATIQKGIDTVCWNG
jgi:hypothetical protein